MRDLRGVGHQEVHEGGVEQLAGLVVDHPLVERAADALRHPAVHLALDDHRVDHGAAVVHHAVAQDPDLGGHRVGLDDRRVHAVGEGRLGGRVEVLALEPRLLVVGHRRLGGVVAAGELGGRLGRLVEGVAQRVGQHRDGAQRHVGAGCALDPDDAVDDLEVLGRTSSASAAMRSALARTLRAASAIALPLITAAREAKVPTAYGIRRVSPVVTKTSLDRHAELLGDDLGERRLVPLALGGQPGRRP